MSSLWGPEFDEVPKVKKTKSLLKKINNPIQAQSLTKKVTSKSTSIEDRLILIKDEVYRILGKYKDDTLVIHTREELKNYIDKSIENGIIAIDTETNNSLDPITCKIMGACIYTPNMKNAYVPVNHTTLDGVKLTNQVTEQDIKEEFDRLKDTKIIMHNGKFDYQVIKCTCNCELDIYWDTLIGAKIIDENERAGLKQQYIEKIDPSIEKYDIENLFQHVDYAIVDPDLFALYAATDSYMTYKLYLWQVNKFNQEDTKSTYNLFKNIEMPVVKVIAEMELSGMDVDQEYASRLSNKYHKILEGIDFQITEELKELQPKIDSWLTTDDANYHPPKKTGDGVGKSKAEQLENPINLGSPTQLAILFYDVLKAPQVNKKSPRATGEEELKALKEKLNLKIFDLILKRREISKLTSTYIDVIPELAKRWPDGRVRTHFNQYGAATGRLSSSDPINFQNIPSHNKEIRMLFKARNGYKIVGGDFSQQEPKLTAHYSGDENMINAYLEGKDLYAIIASKSFNKPYEDCLEFYPEGTKIIFEGKEVITGKKTHQNKEGKQRRSYAKSILLGLLYGRGAASVGEQIGKSRDEAQEIIDSFFKAFPKVYSWIEESKKFAYANGYVEDVVGRRRRLPDILLPKYDIKLKNGSTDFNPLLGAKGLVTPSSKVVVDKYKEQLSKVTYKRDIDKIKEDAFKEGVEIHDNSGFIAQAERQAVNARVQGGAATLTKCALLWIFNDQRLKDINARLINTVHDEILLEVPDEYSEQCEKYLQEDMIQSAKQYVPEVPMKCDTYNVNCWYEDEYHVTVQEEFKHLIDGDPKKNIPPMEEQLAFDKMCNDRLELTKQQMYDILCKSMTIVPKY